MRVRDRGASKEGNLRTFNEKEGPKLNQRQRKGKQMDIFDNKLYVREEEDEKNEA